MSSQEIFIETLRIGNAIRVTAIHAESGLEVVFQAPFNTSRKKLQQLAGDKLRYVIMKGKESP